MAELVVFGSARVDAFLEVPPDKAEQECSLDSKDCFIKLTYAAKISLKSATYLLGGNGANVAVGTKRLGIDNYLVAELGCGMMADFAAKTLVSEGINMKYVTQTKGVPEGFGAVINYQGERTILSYYPPQRPPFPTDLPSAKWAYLTSIGENFEDFFEDVYLWLSKNDTKLVFNPGGRQIKKGKAWLLRFLEKCEILIVNREEAQEICEFDNNSYGEEKQLLDDLYALGPKNVIVTDGANGSYARNANGYYKCGILPVDVCEKTGAGDSYSSGCIAALIKGKSLQEGMIWGTVNAASKIGFVGPQRGLLYENQLRDWLDKIDKDALLVNL
ncbi:MAG: carbohydrate kinase family protein [Patescibacteria group bacterium]|nr:carbohydrate kinase family protein [Patescibacteria group bacterium]